MKRTIVLLDITAMSGDAVCIAGLDIHTGQTIRLNDPQPTRKDVARLQLATGDVIDVDWEPDPNPSPPHVEDGSWKPRSAKSRRQMPRPELQELASSTAFTSVREAFGPEALRGHNGNHAWPWGKGSRSLATIWVRYVRADDANGRIRIACRDQAGDYWPAIPFQDLQVKIHASECTDCRAGQLEIIRRDFNQSRAPVRMGLTRAFAPDSEQAASCWLQVTNVLTGARTHF